MIYIFKPIFINVGYLLLLSTMRCAGLTKRFVASWDFTNERNWKDAVTPCPGRDVTFATKPDTPILMAGEVSFNSMDLSFDLEIIFGEKLSLQFNSQADQSCSGSQTGSVFKNKAKGYWWDPDSWKCEDGEAYECSAAVPYIYRVPCLSDSIKMPNISESLYKVIFTRPTPTVKSLTLGNQNLTTSKFFEFATSTEGTERITVENYKRDDRIPLFVESEGSCSDVTGCTCHASTPTEEICRHMKWKCPKITCSSPVKMYGFCCPMCGSEISISHNGTIALSSIQGILSRVLNLKEANKVDGYVGKMPDDLIHVYFMPQEEWVDYRDAVHTFAELFARELNPSGVHVVMSSIAGGTVAEKLIEEKRSKTTSSIAIALFSVLIVCLVIVAVYLLRKRRVQDLPFMFRRLSMARLSSRSTRSVSIPPSTQVATFSTSQGRSFINPTFNDSESLDSFPSIASVQTALPDIPEVECPTRRENPLFGAKMDEGVFSFTALSKKTKSEEEGPHEETGDSMDDSVHPGDIAAEAPDEILISVDESSDPKDSECENKVENEENPEEDPLEELAKSRVEKVQIEFETHDDNDDVKNIILESSDVVDQDTLDVIDLSSSSA